MILHAHHLGIRGHHCVLYSFLRAFMPIMQELAREGIVKKVPEIHIRDLVGQYSHLGSAQRRDPKRAGVGADPSMADIRRVATLCVVLLSLIE